VLNRQGMERVLSREMERAVRDKTPLSLMIMDIDGFRRLNESRGYVAAELILKTLIALCQGLLAVEDVIGRWGGDEFMVLTPRSSEAARLLADSMRDVAHSSSLGVEGALTLSVGIAQFRAEMDLSSLVGAAYDAMVRAKRNGGNRAVTAEDGEGR
ncbi:GGDEF domain-containing protein, partial [Fretibacterium fastidiosum]